MSRTAISEYQLSLVLDAVKLKLADKMNKYGPQSFISRHEILGVVEEEMHELRGAVQKGSQCDVSNELMDVAVGAIFGIVSIQVGVEW